MAHELTILRFADAVRRLRREILCDEVTDGDVMLDAEATQEIMIALASLSQAEHFLQLAAHHQKHRRRS